MTLNDTATIVALAGTSLTGAGFVTRWLYRGWKTGTRTWDRIDKGMYAMQHDLENISREVRMNGGASIKDQMNVMVKDVKAIHHETRVSTAARRIGQSRAICEVLISPDGDRYEFVTDEWTRITGLTREGMEDGGWLRCVPIADQPRIHALADAANAHGTIFQAEYTAIHVVTRGETPVRHIGHPVFSHADVLVGWVGELIPLPPLGGTT